MRETETYRLQAASAKRASLLLGQFEFLQTRQEAFERVISVSKWYDRVKWIFRPDALLAIVDAVQINLMNQHKAALAEQAAKPKIDVVGALH